MRDYNSYEKFTRRYSAISEVVWSSLLLLLFLLFVVHGAPRAAQSLKLERNGLVRTAQLLGYKSYVVSSSIPKMGSLSGNSSLPIVLIEGTEVVSAVPAMARVEPGPVEIRFLPESPREFILNRWIERYTILSAAAAVLLIEFYLGWLVVRGLYYWRQKL